MDIKNFDINTTDYINDNVSNTTNEIITYNTMDIEKVLEYAFHLHKGFGKVPLKVVKNLNNVNVNIAQECDHLDIIEDGGTKTCADCGFEMGRNSNFEKEWRYYGEQDNSYSSDPSRCHYRKITEKSIFKDVENMGLPNHIICKSDQLFDMVTRGDIYRGKTRKAIIFACVFQSFKVDGNPKSLEYLQKKFELKRKVISKGMNHFGMNVTRDAKIVYQCISPNDLIPEILHKLNADNKHITNVMELYKIIKNRSSLLNRSKPQSIGSGLVWYYCVYTKKSTTIKELSLLVRLSEATIEKIAKEIDNILKTGFFKKKKKRGRIPKNIQSSLN